MSVTRWSLGIVFLLACGPTPQAEPTQATATPAKSGPSLVATASAAAPPAPALTPAAAQDIGMVFEAYLSPMQEGGEEEDTPKSVPEQFRSKTPSKSRAEREAAGHRAHGQLRFTKDMSRAFVDVKIEGVDLENVNMFHIHCGKPGILGPILVDFAQITDVKDNIADGMFSLEIRNEHLVSTATHDHGIVAAFTAGCVIPSPSLNGLMPTKVNTVAGMAQLARDSELYFNLHTTGQTYFGDIRGQLHAVTDKQ